ncbi:MAG: hypothetical protein DUD39_18930 [Coriobacteriaceae bacterium]|nr:MAG: hypothetical protein DUD39_18930 [Coriobacteriaceae bacterium]
MGRSGWARIRGFFALIGAIHIGCPALWGKEDIEDAAKARRGTFHPLQGVLRLMELAGICPCCTLPSPPVPSWASRRFLYLLKGKVSCSPTRCGPPTSTYVQIEGKHLVS